MVVFVVSLASDIKFIILFSLLRMMAVLGQQGKRKFAYTQKSPSFSLALFIAS
jgi:hypothetical protein